VSKTTVGDIDQLPQSPSQLAARQAAIDWLMGRINYERVSVIPYQERQLKLDRMRQLLTRLGQPDAGMKIIHVAGTKGKGSTSAMMAAMLTAAGYRTGVFSSPHLERIEERFSVDGEPCSAEELVSLVDRMRPIVAAMDEEAAAEGDPADGPTYFEVTTAMALVHFVERQVDAAVLEVGLGGRLDSTNVCLPAVSVITSISLDHTKQLGNTLAAIAREKAGIIKPGVPVVCGVTEAEPQAVIAAIAREHGCRLIQLENDFGFEYSPNGDRQGDKGTRRQGEKETRGEGDKGTRRQGDKGTRRQGDEDSKAH
jgi:dihydrofolate synthase / folylpolyglutamate synthase